MAKKAAEKTNQSIVNEQGDMANLVGDIQNLLGEGTSVDRTGINIGDYIDYKPDGFDAEGVPTYFESELGPTYTGSVQNTNIQQDRNMKWQVLKIYDNGEIDIIGTQTSQEVYFQGATGYNNGVYILNDICKTLYSREADGIYARSVNSKDFEDAETPTGKTAREKYISDEVGKLTEDGTYITKVDKTNKTVTWQHGYSYYLNLYAEENGSGTKDNGVIKSDGLKEYESKQDENGTPVITSTEPETSQKTQADSLTTTYTYYFISINENNYGEASKVLSNNSYYWLASRFVACISDCATFGLCGANVDFGGVHVFDSKDTSRNNLNGGLRPIVHLGSNVQITPSESATNPDTPHTITEYK